MAIFILSAEGYRRNICHVFTCKRKILDSRLLWIKHNNVKNRILKSQKDYYKDWSNNVKKADVNNISTGQYPSSGLLGKTTNIQNIYYCKIVKGSYMVWHGKVWLLRKINRKKDKDYQWLLFVTFVDFQRLDGFGCMNEVRLPWIPKTIAFIIICCCASLSDVPLLILNFGSEVRWTIPGMGVKFANPSLELGLKYHHPLPLV